MAWIEVIPEDRAEGLLAKMYQDAKQRAGKVFNVLKVQSLNAKSMRAGVALYKETTRADSPVSRALREMIATVVSRANRCHY